MYGKIEKNAIGSVTRTKHNSKICLTGSGLSIPVDAFAGSKLVSSFSCWSGWSISVDCTRSSRWALKRDLQSASTLPWACLLLLSVMIQDKQQKTRLTAYAQEGSWHYVECKGETRQDVLHQSLHWEESLILDVDYQSGQNVRTILHLYSLTYSRDNVYDMGKYTFRITRMSDSEINFHSGDEYEQSFSPQRENLSVGCQWRQCDVLDPSNNCLTTVMELDSILRLILSQINFQLTIFMILA